MPDKNSDIIAKMIAKAEQRKGDELAAAAQKLRNQQEEANRRAQWDEAVERVYRLVENEITTLNHRLEAADTKMAFKSRRITGISGSQHSWTVRFEAGSKGIATSFEMDFEHNREGKLTVQYRVGRTLSGGYEFPINEVTAEEIATVFHDFLVKSV